MKSKVMQVYIITAVVALLVVAIGYMTLISPAMAARTKLNAQVAAQQVQNVGLQAKIAQLTQLKNDLPQEAALIKQLQAQLPDAAGLAQFYRNVEALQSTTGVSVLSVSPALPTLDAAFTPGGQAAVVAQAGSAAGQGLANAGAAQASVQQAMASTNGIYDVAVTYNLEATGAAAGAKINRFLGLVQTGNRAFLVTQVGLVPATTPGAPYNATVTGRFFYVASKAPPAGGQAALVPLGPTASPSPSATPAATPSTPAATPSSVPASVPAVSPTASPAASSPAASPVPTQSSKPVASPAPSKSKH